MDQYQGLAKSQKLYSDLVHNDENASEPFENAYETFEDAYENLDDIFGSDTETEESGEIMDVEHARSDCKARAIGIPSAGSKDPVLRDISSELSPSSPSVDK
jgi:hypothetical protein